MTLTPTLTVRNVWTTLEASPVITDLISDRLAVYEKNYFFSDAYKKGYWDGKKRFYQARFNMFYTGLLPQVIQVLHHKGIPFNLIDDRGSLPTLREFEPLGLTLRDDQQGIVKDALEYSIEYAAGKRLWFPRRIVQSPTGTGKTVLLATMAGRITGQVGILVHRREIMYQAIEDLKAHTGEQIGYMGDGVYRTGRITVAMVQSLAIYYKKNKWLQGLDALLLDECQHFKAATFAKVAQACPAPIRIGVSATPWTDDDPPSMMTITGLTGPQYEAGSPGEFIDKGVLAPVDVVFMPVKTPTDLGDLPWIREADNDMNVYDQGIVYNEDRNNTLVALAQSMVAKGKRTLVLASRIPHGLLLSELLGAVPYLTGDTPSEVRKETLADFREGKIPLLVATTIFDEGVNVPAINCLILAGGGKSETQTLQRIGRGMRKKLDGSGLVVFDCMDYQHRILLRHSKARKKICTDAGYTVTDFSVHAS